MEQEYTAKANEEELGAVPIEGTEPESVEAPPVEAAPDEYIEEAELDTFVEEVEPDPVGNQQARDAVDRAGTEVARAGEDAPEGLMEEVIKRNSLDPEYVPTDSEARAAEARVQYFNDIHESIYLAQAKNEAIDAQAIADKAAAFNTASMGVYGGFRAAVDNNPDASYMPEKMKEDIAKMDYLRHSAALVMDELGVGGHFLEVGAMFALPEGDNIRSAAIADALDRKFDGSDFANDAAFQGGLVAEIKRLPPKESIEFIDDIREALAGLYGPNAYYSAAYLNDLTGDYRVDSKVMERSLMGSVQVAEAGIITYGVGRFLAAGRGIRKLAKLGAIKATTQAIKAGAKGELIAEGVSPMDALTSLTPLKQLESLNQGADTSRVKEVVDTLDEVNLQLADVDKVNNYGLGLDKAAQDAAIKRGIKELREQEGLLEISEVSRDAQGFTLKYKTGKGHGKAGATAKAEREGLQARVNGTAQTLKGFEDDMVELGDDVTDADRAMLDEAFEEAEDAKAELADFDKTAKIDNTPEYQERVVTYKVEDQNEFVSDGKKGFFRWAVGIVSPNNVFSADKKHMVQLPEQMNFQSGAIKGSYESALTKALGKLDKTAYQEVDLLLTKGDESGVVFTDSQLLNGDVGGHKFSTEQVAAYRGVRQVIDHMFLAKNKQILDGYSAQGIKMASWGDMKQQVALKGYKDVNAARTGFRQADTKSYYVAKQNSDGYIEAYDFKSADDMTDDFLRQQYDEGYELTRVQHNHLLKVDETHAEWAFVKRSDMREPSGFVLNRRTGYMPKIRKDGHFFVKRNSTIPIGTGSLKGAPETIRYFDNSRDAHKWAAEQPDAKDLNVLADGEMSSAARDEEYTNLGGGFIVGPRSSKEIPFGLPEHKLDGTRVDALEGLQKYVNHLSQQVPMHLYRMGIREKWLQSAKKFGALKGDPRAGFDEMVDYLDEKHEAYEFLKQAHNQVSLISRVPTDAEKKQRAATTSIAHWLEGKGGIGRWLAKRMHGKNAGEGVAGAAKAATFNTLLGMYNPAQFIIQASGALVALSVNPVSGIRAIRQSMGYAMLDRMIARAPAHLDDHLAFAKKMGIDTEGYEMYSKSGLRQSITSANSDFQSIWEDLPYDAGRLRKIVANHTYFFKSGELVSARISFATAFNRWKSMNPGKVASDLDMQDILGRTEQYRLNMSKANNAGFQQGNISGVMTQFQQVQTKFMEKLLGSDFTPMEKTRLALGQATMFGAAGVPLAGFATPIVLDALGLNAENLTESEMTAVRNGGMTWFLNDFMDINAVVTGRISLGGDFLERIWLATTEAGYVTDLALGPTSSLLEKGDNIIMGLRAAFSGDLYGEELDINEVALVSEILGRSWAPVAGSVNNLVKAYDMTHSKFYRTKAGKPIFAQYDNNWQTIAFQAIGFGPSSAADYYEVTARHGGAIPASSRNIDAKRILYVANSIRSTDDPKGTKVALYAINAIKSKYSGKDADKLIKQVLNLLKNPTGDVWNKEVVKLLQESELSLTKSWADTVKMAKARTNTKVASELDDSGKEKKGVFRALKDNFTGGN